MSREKILNAVRDHQPEQALLPEDLIFDKIAKAELVKRFIEMLTLIGARVIQVQSTEEIEQYIQGNFGFADEKMIRSERLNNYTQFTGAELPHHFAEVEFAIFEPRIAVAENGAVWLTEKQMGHRVLPFITQHLAMIVSTATIVANMHEAYQQLEETDEGFGTFIAGPSKTADIEQSLVLGAHGARSMTIFLMD